MACRPWTVSCGQRPPFSLPGWPRRGSIPAIFAKITGHYLFPESHSHAFAITAYQAAWLKRYYPLEFFVALVNQQPMGFYPLETLKEDARRFGVPFRTPCLNRSRAQAIPADGGVRPAAARLRSFAFHSLVHKDIRGFIKGSTRSKLTQHDMRRIAIAIPGELAEAEVIGDMSDATDETLAGFQASIGDLRLVKTTTADVLLTGRVRVAT